MTNRNDIHRPSAIDSAAYVYIGYAYLGNDPFTQMAAATERQRVEAARTKLGAGYSRHEHGGTCHVCGAHALHLAVWHHPATNTFIRTGEDCATKFGLPVSEFLRTRRDIDGYLDAQKGIRKMLATIADAGMPEAAAYAYGWVESPSLKDMRAAYEAASQSGDRETAYRLRDSIMVDKSHRPRACDILQDLLDKLVRYGTWSDKQANFARKLVAEIPAAGARESERVIARKAADAAAKPVPVSDKRMTVEGVVISTREGAMNDAGMWCGPKMLVQHADGWKVWGTIPSHLEVVKGDHVRFDGKVTPSPTDTKFGFFSRPTKASKLETAAV